MRTASCTCATTVSPTGSHVDASRRHADDLVSEGFRRVLTAISRGAGPTQAFGPYLATTIRSAAAGLAAPFQEVELTASSELVDDHGDVDPRVSTAFLSLPEPWQNTLWYTDVEGMAPRHAAPLMGLQPNAFSALHVRARAGLRSAYLTQVVDDVCNDDVRQHLELLVAGKVGADVVDALVDEHLDSCDTCGAVAWRIAAVTGTKLGVTLAPAILAFHGFGIGAALLPKALGAAGLLGWLRRSPGQAAAVGAVTVLALVVGLGVAFGGGGGDDRSGQLAVPVESTVADGLSTPESAAPSTSPADPSTPSPRTSSTSSTATTTPPSITTSPSTTTPLSTTSVLPGITTTTAVLGVVPPTTQWPTIVTTPSRLLGTIPVPTTTTPPPTTIATATTAPTGTTTTTTPTTTTTTTSTTTTSTTTTTTTTTTTNDHDRGPRPVAGGARDRERLDRGVESSGRRPDRSVDGRPG